MSHRRRAPVIALGLCLGLVLAARPATAVIDSNLAIAKNGGGCYPTGVTPGLLDMLTLVNPEWAPVVAGMTVSSTPVIVHGLVTTMHGDTSGDFPSTHLRADVNYDAIPDPADQQYVATGNDNGQLHIEWEAGAYPAFAWASIGDRIVVMGRQIFDCGHPGATPGHCSATMVKSCVTDTDCNPPLCPSCGGTETCEGVQFGYGSELHPPYASAAIRQGRGGIVSNNPAIRPVLAARADIFVSANGGGAGDSCVLTHHASDLDLLSVQCWPLAQPTAPINSRDFAFSIPLPPRPPRAHASWRMTPYPAPGGAQARFRVRRVYNEPTGPRLDVVIRLTRRLNGGTMPTGFAGTLETGWVRDPTPLAHVRVTLDSLVVRNALQPVTPTVPRTCSGNDAPCTTTTDCPSGESCFGLGPVKSWRGQASVNGLWQELVNLSSVNTSDVVPQQLVFDQYLRPNDTLSVHADARSHECLDEMYGRSLAQSLVDLGFNKGVTCLATSARNPGDVDASYAGPDFGGGVSGTQSYETVSHDGVGGNCTTTTSMLCTVDADCPPSETCHQTGQSMALRYTIERLAN